MEIYLDANATTPVLFQAAQAARQVMAEDFGNPSSVHSTGLKARAMLDQVRARARRLLDTGAGHLLFVSGATEGIQTAVLSALNELRSRRAAGDDSARWLLYGATEHKAVPEALKHWSQLLGLDLPLLAIPVNRQGLHDLDFLREHAPQAGIVCTMAANNETGVISDLAGIEAVLQQTGSQAMWLVDSVQALGKLELHLSRSRIDYAPFSGHKLYAPKGVGLLYVREGAPFTPLLAGGGQEGSLRSGTENMAGIAALGAVLAAFEDGSTFRDEQTLRSYQARLAAALEAAFPGLIFNAEPALSLPTTLNFAVPGLSSRLLQDLFDAAESRVSGGSACSAAKAQPSYVLQAMGLPEWQAAGAVRMSFGPVVDEAFISEACARIAACGLSLRRNCLSPVGNDPTIGDGITRFTQDGACCYLLADSASQRCLLIDPLPEMVDALAQALQCQGYPLLAVLGSKPEHQQARALLAQSLGDLMPAAACDASGWPLHHETLTLGASQLSRQQQGEGPLLLSVAGQAQLAFTGGLDRMALEHLPPDLLLAPGSDEEQQFATTRAVCHALPVLALEGAKLQAFVDAHPDALLVDVREPYEQFLSLTPKLNGVALQAMPLSRLLNALPTWLVEQRPLLFFCRSGNRSRQAAMALARLGHSQAWTLVGGLALLPSAPAEQFQPDPALYV